MDTLVISKKALIVSVAISIVAILGLTISTNPSSIGPFGILMWFVLAYCVVVNILLLIYAMVLRRKIQIEILLKMMSIALFIVAIMGLRSLGQLHVRDMLLLGGLAGVCIFYLERRFQK